MTPVADLVINPRRAYSASEPSNAELIELGDEFNPTIEEQVDRAMNTNLTLREKGVIGPKMVPVADLVINPRRAYSASEPSNAQLVGLGDEFNPTIEE